MLLTPFNRRRKATETESPEFVKPSTTSFEIPKVVPKRKLVNKVKKPEILKKPTKTDHQRVVKAVTEDTKGKNKQNILLNDYSSSSDSE